MPTGIILRLELRDDPQSMLNQFPATYLLQDTADPKNIDIVTTVNADAAERKSAAGQETKLALAGWTVDLTP